jgi:hypothetical protein
MAKLVEVQAGKKLLESFVRTPQQALCELIWNAFDAEAETVSVAVESNSFGAVERIVVTDDGEGMTGERATLAFEKFGDSWKAPEGTTSAGPKKRPVHGRHGRGRYTAFALGNQVRWLTTSESVAGSSLESVQIDGERATLDRCSVDVMPAIGESTGTVVSIVQVPPEVSRLFEKDELGNRLLTEFALHLDRYPDFKIEFLGTRLDHASAIDLKSELEVELPNDFVGEVKFVVVEWNLTGVDRRIYLGTEDGTILDETQPRIQAPGAEFTAYLFWDGFKDPHARELLIGDTSTPAGTLLDAARNALRAYMSERQRSREAETVRAWRAEGVYPYRGDPADEFERAKRETFDVVAFAAARSVNETRSRNLKMLALNLLKQTLESDPESLLPILTQVSTLPESRIEELRQILDRTTLSRLIEAGPKLGPGSTSSTA